jgi:hypothetical protein
MKNVRLTMSQHKRWRENRFALIDSETGEFCRYATTEESMAATQAGVKKRRIRVKENGRILNFKLDRERLKEELIKEHGGTVRALARNTKQLFVARAHVPTVDPQAKPVAPHPNRCNCAEWEDRPDGKHHPMCKMNKIAPPEHRADLPDLELNAGSPRQRPAGEPEPPEGYRSLRADPPPYDAHIEIRNHNQSTVFKHPRGADHNWGPWIWWRSLVAETKPVPEPESEPEPEPEPESESEPESEPETEAEQDADFTMLAEPVEAGLTDSPELDKPESTEMPPQIDISDPPLAPTDCECAKWMRPEGSERSQHHPACPHFADWAAHEEGELPHFIFTKSGTLMRRATAAEKKEAREKLEKVGLPIINIGNEEFLCLNEAP